MSVLEARALQLKLERKMHFSGCSYSVPARISGQGNQSRVMSSLVQHRCDVPPRPEQISEAAGGGKVHYQHWKTGMFSSFLLSS